MTKLDLAVTVLSSEEPREGEEAASELAELRKKIFEYKNAEECCVRELRKALDELLALSKEVVAAHGPNLAETSWMRKNISIGRLDKWLAAHPAESPWPDCGDPGCCPQNPEGVDDLIIRR